MLNASATTATLRQALAPYFVDLDLYFRELSEAKLLPANCSARLTVRQAAVSLIAISTGLSPAEAPAEALRIAGFKLHCRSECGWRGRPIELPEASVPSFLDFVEQQIEAARGALPKAPALAFFVGVDKASVSIPAMRGGGLLSFKPTALEQRPDAGRGRGISGAIIEVVAGLFEPIGPEEIEPELTARLAAALGFEGSITWH